MGSVLSWPTSDIQSLRGRSIVVTGTGGLGFEIALALTRAGGDVTIAGRNPEAGASAVQRIRAATMDGQIRFEWLDLASLNSVERFAARLHGIKPCLDVLINNAGVMAPPRREETKDGFELQFGVNYLGHFALTARLASLLRASPSPRVVSVASLTHRVGAIRFEDFQWRNGYKAHPAYAQSKLALLMFALELQRRAAQSGWNLISNGAHPGYARTGLYTNGPGEHGVVQTLNRWFQPLLSHSAADGAQPIVFAATSPQAAASAYYGPTGILELKGPPGQAKVASKAKDAKTAVRLWQESERLTGVTFQL